MNKLLGANAKQEGPGSVWEQQRRIVAQMEADRPARETVRRRSTKEMRLFHFSVINGESQLTFADGTSMSLTTAEVELLQAGKPLPPTHTLSAKFTGDGAAAHVLYSDSKLESSEAYVKNRNALAFGLQAAYPKANIYRDPLSDETSARAKKLNNFSVAGAKDLLVVIE